MKSPTITYVGATLDDKKLEELAATIPEAYAMVPAVPTLKQVEDPEFAKHWTDYWFAMVSQCQQTEGFEGYLRDENRELQYYRGTDYMYLAAQRLMQWRESYFHPLKVRDLELDGYLDWYRDDKGNPGHSTKDIGDRFLLMQDGLLDLSLQYGDLQHLIKAADHTLAGENGVFDRLSRIHGFDKDPEEKKARLLTLFLHQINAVQWKDPENLRSPIDYHIVRTLLRTGVIDLSEDPALTEKLLRQEPVSAEDDNYLRKLADEAIRKMAAANPKADVGKSNHALWAIGRSYCFRDKEKTGKITPECRQFVGQTLIDQNRLNPRYRDPEELKKRLTPNCPLSKMCMTSRGEMKGLLHEAYIDTTNY